VVLKRDVSGSVTALQAPKFQLNMADFVVFCEHVPY